MCERCAAPNGPWSVARRSVLKLGLAAAMALAPQALMAKSKEPPKPENVLSPDAALDRLMQGNGRYVEGVTRRHDFKHEREPLAQGQNPFAAVLSCADSRIAPEFCFETARRRVRLPPRRQFRRRGNHREFRIWSGSVERAAPHGARP